MVRLRNNKTLSLPQKAFRLRKLKVQLKKLKFNENNFQTTENDNSIKTKTLLKPERKVHFDTSATMKKKTSLPISNNKLQQQRLPSIKNCEVQLKQINKVVKKKAETKDIQVKFKHKPHVAVTPKQTTDSEPMIEAIPSEKSIEKASQNRTMKNVRENSKENSCNLDDFVTSNNKSGNCVNDSRYMTRLFRRNNFSLVANDNKNSVFVPPVNSTFYENSLLNNAEKNTTKDSTNKTTNGQNAFQISSQNLTNKCDLIEHILLSDEPDQNGNLTKLNLNNPSNKDNSKFFHKNNEKEEIQNNPKPKRRKSSFPKRKASVYEFTSSDSDNRDPAADVVKKLIEKGNVCVATTRKGTGKPVYKHIRQKGKKNIEETGLNKPKLKGSKTTSKSVVITKQKEIKNLPENQNAYENCEQVAENVNISENLKLFGKSKVLLESPKKIHVSSARRSHNKNQSNEGMFSSLAQSVLRRNNLSNTKQNDDLRLIETERKLVSTPINKKRFPPVNTFNLSPILTLEQHTKKPSNKSLLRDSTFHVADKSLMPSSPVLGLAGTNSKQKHAKNTFEIPHEHLPAAIEHNSPNDSNEENIPPSIENQQLLLDENDSIFNMRQLPNPRRTLTLRSPLKAINILEVVTLPPWRYEDKEIPLNKSKVETSKRSKSKDNVDLFGFEEYLDNDDEETNLTQNRTFDSRNLSEKLKELKWRSTNLKQSEIKGTRLNATIEDDGLFEDINKLKQPTVKEMLCSTMIHPKKTSTLSRHKTTKGIEQIEQIENNNSSLYKDPVEPETSFNETDPHRTYQRQSKRKLKLRNEDFVMFFDSVESDDEDNHEKEAGKHDNRDRAENDGRVSKKRKRKEANDKEELSSFIHEFNDMCKEVEQFQIPIEGETEI